MDFIQILEQQRETYINQLKAYYETKNEGAKELLIKVNQGDEPIFFDLIRIDHATNIDNIFSPEDLNPQYLINHATVRFNYGNLDIELSPFFWDNCKLIINSSQFDLNKLISWAENWIDAEDQSIINQEGLYGVIHKISNIYKEGNIIEFMVDLGTAPTESLIELIKILEATNIRNLKILNSFELSN
jgi:hypothetical protein